MIQNPFDKEFYAIYAAEVTKDIWKPILNKLKNQWHMSEPSLKSTISEYSENLIRIHGTTKTLIHKDDVFLDNLYIPASFTHENKQVSDNQFFDDINLFKRATIIGHAGAGKSIFLKMYALKRLKNKKSIPVFFELRKFDGTKTLKEFLIDHCKQQLTWINIPTFDKLLEAGVIELCLDALDEVPHRYRFNVNSAIEQLYIQFPNAKIILTTRYGDKYRTPNRVREYTINSLSKQSCIDLVMSLPLEQDYKIMFSKTLKNNLYDRHQGLLSNPLLCTIMLLTYKSFNEIPDELAVYYNQAYEVLFRMHDASKQAGFTRDMISDLDILEMHKVLNYISAHTYTNEKFEFTLTELLTLIEDSIISYKLSSKADNVKDDITEAISMIHLDGTHYKFVHRSFQEYFTATYAVNTRNNIARACINAIKARKYTDNVISMIKVLNMDKFIESWMMPELENDLNTINSLAQSKRYFEAVQYLFNTVYIKGNHIRLMIGQDSINIDMYNDHFRTYKKSIDIFDIQMSRSYSAITIETYVSKSFNQQTMDKKKLIDPINGLKIDLSDKNSFVLQDHEIWNIIYNKVSEILRIWKDTLEAEIDSTSASSIRAFNDAINAGRRVEGDLDGGIHKRKIDQAT